MKPELADCLTLRGTCDYNVLCRWIENKEKEDVNSQLPKHFEELPPFTDHSMLAHLNRKANELEIAPVFKFVTPINDDNGERFLSKYFAEQCLRNEKKLTEASLKLCSCAECQQVLVGENEVQCEDPVLPESPEMMNEASQSSIGGLLGREEAHGTLENSGNSAEAPLQLAPAPVQQTPPPPQLALYTPVFQYSMMHTGVGPFGPTPGCRGCMHTFRRQMGQVVIGRPPIHEVFCPLSSINTLK